MSDDFLAAFFSINVNVCCADWSLMFSPVFYLLFECFHTYFSNLSGTVFRISTFACWLRLLFIDVFFVNLQHKYCNLWGENETIVHIYMKEIYINCTFFVIIQMLILTSVNYFIQTSQFFKRSLPDDCLLLLLTEFLDISIRLFFICVLNIFIICLVSVLAMLFTSSQI